MSEWFITTKLAMAVTEEKIRGKREPIVLERLNLVRHLRPILYSLLSFLF
jgi:hypothetical protein